ncbi:MAG: exo-alpha-sialidase [Prevotella sp.]
MKKEKKGTSLTLMALLLLFFNVAPANATNISQPDEEPAFSVTGSLFDATKKETMGLSYAPQSETYTIWAAGSEAGNDNHYANGVVLTSFKGKMYCMWQTSLKDEDSQDTYVAYATSDDNGVTWSKSMTLCPSIDNGYCSSGGWLSTPDRLIAFINVRTTSIANSGGYTQYMESTDGKTWSAPADVKMSDETSLNGIFEQDPHVLSNGRIIGAAHFQPGLKLCPIYTDDPTGRTGWKKGNFTYTDNGTQSVELEPSFFLQEDGKLVMIMRDQKGSYLTLASTSTDQGVTWTKAVKTNMPDSRAKQCAGNIPDGTAFMVNNPGRVTNSSGTTWRVPLAITTSADGKEFTHSYLLRSGMDDDYPARRYEGKAKTLGYSYPKALISGDYLYVSYSTNKDDAQLTRIPIKNLSLNSTDVNDILASDESISIIGRTLKIHTRTACCIVEILDISGRLYASKRINSGVSEFSLDHCIPGIYILRIVEKEGVKARKIQLR